MRSLGILQSVLAVIAIGGGLYLFVKNTRNEDEEETKGIDGSNEQVLLAENNHPFGQYFHDPVGITVSSKPFYRRLRRVYN